VLSNLFVNVARTQDWVCDLELFPCVFHTATLLAWCLHAYLALLFISLVSDTTYGIHTHTQREREREREGEREHGRDRLREW
jgi:hypothetical protein